MSETQELPAVYRALSEAALERLLESYRARHAKVRGFLLRDLFSTRIRFIEEELARRRP